MIEPKEIEIDGKKFTLSKFPAIAGRKIIASYPMSSLPKLGDYQANEEAMLLLMSYVSKGTLRLSTRELIDNHVGGWETLAKLEIAMLEYNCSFLASGRISGFLDGITSQLPELITKILILFSQSSLPKEKPVSKNLKKATA